MKLKRGMRVLGLLIIMVLVGGIFLLVVSADEHIQSMDNQMNSGAIFEISGFTHALKTDVSSSDSTLESLSDEYGELNIPSTVRKYDIVQFSQTNLNPDQNNSLKRLLPRCFFRT